MAKIVAIVTRCSFALASVLVVVSGADEPYHDPYNDPVSARVSHSSLYPIMSMRWHRKHRNSGELKRYLALLSSRFASLSQHE